MTICESTLHSSVTGTEIYQVSALPDDSVAGDRGNVLVLHGLGDHIGCHEKALEILCNLGFQAFGFDWPGNGKSEGTRGDIPGVKPAINLIREVVDQLDQKPVGIYAHSTGAFLLLPYLHRDRQTLPLKWIWLSSPLLRPTHRQSVAKKWMTEVLAEWAPGLSIPTGVKPSRCYHVDEADEKAVTDEFRERHSRISTRLGRDLILWEQEVARSASELTDPLSILITQGDEDRICPPEFAGEMFHSIPADDKTFLLLKGYRHEPLREPDNQDFLDTVRSWLEAKS